ncbi:MAG TPA: MMPL family transporter [Verrucomicrobiae bacterium]|jgi:predicted RND superfamily exporter protein|nr:MMPL family transporter [Verrucomicrobiae bacterium]
MAKSSLPSTQNNFGKAFARFVCRYPLGILIFFAVSTAALVPVAARLKLHANFMDLLPDSHPSIVNLEELMSHVGGTSFLIAVIESKDEKTALDATNLFSEKAAHFQQVEFVDNRTNVPEFANRKLLFLNLKSVEKLKSNISDLLGYYRRKNNPLYVDLLDEKEPKVDEGLELEEKVSRIGGFSAKDQESYMQVILIKPKHPVSDFNKTELLFAEARAGFAEVQKQLKKPASLGLTGPYRTRYEEYLTIHHDIHMTGLIVTALLVIINLLAFPNLRSLAYVYLPLTLGTVWVWGFTELTIGYLNLITAFLAAILFGMESDYSLHFLVTFEQNLKTEEGNVEKAIELAFAQLWSPMWASMWTTAVVFYSLMISQFEGFRHFGFIAGVGIMISFVIILFVEPALIVLIEKYFPMKRWSLFKEMRVSKPLLLTIVLGGVLFSFFSLTQIPKVGFNYNFMDLRAKKDDSVDLAEKVGMHFGVHLTPVVYITPNREVAGKLADDLNRYIDSHPGTFFDFAAAITSHVPHDQEQKIKVLGEINQMIESRKAILKNLDEEKRQKIDDLRAQLAPQPFVIKDLPDGIVNQYEGHDGVISAVFVYPAVRILNGEKAKKFVQEARDFPKPPGVKLAGEPLIYADILMLIEKDTPIAIGISTFVVFFLVLLHFRRLDHTLWVHVPLALAGLWMVGMMGITGFKFNFFNMVIMPSILGHGIDNGIYIFDWYNRRKDESFLETIRTSFKGVLLASGTSIAAFTGIMFATHRGMASMGKLGVIGFSSCLLASVIFLPALLGFFELRYKHLFHREGES